ncbi:MAG TPA: twin-arginine translocase TatA/TatE family subunit [Solirubrobacteraceae bacterium]|jgi:sec-independent protein translocase protein TatA|nr:twin-arginine translocase TatA/TatE family subunit [Solirubrobacteraceae bacterium]
MGLDNPLHIAFLVVILLLVFGARRLPEIGRSLGSGMREFKDSITGETKQPAPPTISQAAPPASPPPAAAQPAAAAFGTPPPEQASVPAEPTRQA